MSLTRRHTLKAASLALALAVLGTPAVADDGGYRSGHLFTSTNSPAGNELLAFHVAEDGSLSFRDRFATGGLGSGGGLGNQGAVTLSRTGRFLFVVNAASNTVSTFAIRDDGIELRSTVDSGGVRPVSVTEHRGLVYVLNAGGDGNVSGFRNLNGQLEALPGSTRGLSAPGGTGPAQVSFSPDGSLLLVTEKATNLLTSYVVGDEGLPGAPIVTASAGATPFGFAFDRRGHALVSEAFGGAAGASAVSSYRFDAATPAVPIVVSPSVGTTQSAACWVVVTPNSRFAYVTNTASNTISSYRIGRDGAIALAEAVAATSDAGPIDAAVSRNGRHLFALNGAGNSLTAYGIGADGRLAPAGNAMGLPAGANGLAAN